MINCPLSTIINNFSYDSIHFITPITFKECLHEDDQLFGLDDHPQMNVM